MGNDGGKKAVKTTIVGGQPPGNERELPEIPVGIEELLGMAAVNDDFAKALFDDREQAITASGVALTPTERGILGAIDQSILKQMVSRVEGGVPSRDRRAFLHRSAAALLVLAGGGAVAQAAAGCGDPKPSTKPPTPPGPADAAVTRPPADADVRVMAGISPGAVDAGRQVRPPAVEGIRPDRPEVAPSPSRGISPDRPNVTPPASRGISPDRPRPQPTKGIRPDRPPVDLFPEEVKDKKTRGIRPDRPKPKVTGSRPDRPKRDAEDDPLGETDLD